MRTDKQNTMLEDKLGILISLSEMEGCPYSDADIAEKIRVWMEKQANEIRFKYSVILCDGWEDDDEGLMLDDWLVLHCTPADKIQAALSVWDKENE